MSRTLSYYKLLTNLCRYGSGAISLLSELLKLDWRKRLNAIDALQHPYFRNAPLPARPGDLPTFEESHELDRRKFRGQKAAPPPAPKGGTVGMGPNSGQGGWGGEPGGNGNHSYGNGDNYGHGYRPHQNGGRYPPHGDHRNGVPPPPDGRRPAWRQNERPDTRLPPRPPPPAQDQFYDGPRSDNRDGYRSRSRDIDRERPQLPRSRAGGPNIDTYIPSYGPDSGRPPREDRSRSHDDRPRRRDDHDRRHDRDRDRDRERIEYDDRSLNGRTRSRSRSPTRERDRERIRDREPLDRERERDVYRR